MTIAALWKDVTHVKKDRAKSNPRMWTTKEEQFLIDNYPTLRTKGVAHALNRTEASVSVRANNLRVRGYDIEDPRVWSEEETQFLIDNYKTKSNQVIADMLGKTYSSVQSKLSDMGLRRNKRGE